MNYLIYSRVSPRGSGWTGETSCETQAAEVKRYVLARDPAAKFKHRAEEFKSGTSISARPLFSKIIAEISDPSWDVLAVLDMDRLARSQKGWVQIAELLADHNKGLICVRQDVDFTSIQGRMVLGMFSVIGEFFAKSGAQKTRDKMRYMAQHGLWCGGNIPLGYLKPSTQKNTLDLDPVTAPIVKDIFQSYMAGQSTTALSRRLDLSVDKITRILRNPIYRGRIVYGDIDVQGKHPAIVTDDLWAAAKIRLPGRCNVPRPQAQLADYLLSGKVFCACGKVMAASSAIGGSHKRYPYYRCSESRCQSNRKMIRADRLDAAVLDQIAAKADHDQTIEANYSRMVGMVMTIRTQTDGELAKLKELQAPLTAKAQNVKAAIESGALKGSALKAMAEDLDELYGQIWAINADIRIHEQKISASVAPDTVQQLADAWRRTAHDMAAGGSLEDRRKWMALHIDNVQHVSGDQWKIRFLVDQGSVKVRTQGGEWYPERWLCELFLTLSKRAA